MAVRGHEKPTRPINATSKPSMMHNSRPQFVRRATCLQKSRSSPVPSQNQRLNASRAQVPRRVIIGITRAPQRPPHTGVRRRSSSRGIMERRKFLRQNKPHVAIVWEEEGKEEGWGGGGVAPYVLVTAALLFKRGHVLFWDAQAVGPHVP